VSPNTLIIFLSIAIIGGSTAALVKFAVLQFPPVFLVFIRALFSSLLLLPFFLKERSNFKKDKISMLILGGLLITANGLLFAFGIQYTSVIAGQLIYVPTALIVAILGWIFLKEKIGSNQVVGLALTILGIAILYYGSISTKDKLSFGSPFGNSLIILGLLCWSGFVVISKKLSKVYTPLQITFFSFLTAIPISLIFLPLEFYNHSISNLNVTTAGILAVASLIIFSTVLYFFLYQIVINKTSAFSSSLILYLQAIIAAIIGVIFFDEKLTFLLFVGALLIVIGIIGSTRIKKE